MALRARAVGALLVLAAILAGCGAHAAKRSVAPPVRRTPLHVYASLPLHGVWAPQGTAIANGVKLALSDAGNAAGRWNLKLRLLDDSASPANAARDARLAGGDPAAVYYIGELDSAASELSAPVLNVAGVPQLSPLSTSVTDPAALDPTPGRPTFLRLAPSDSVQAAAELRELAHQHCQRVAVVHDGSLEGSGLAAQLQARRRQFGVHIARVEALGSAPAAVAAVIKSQGDDCVVFAGTGTSSAAALLTALASPRLRLVLGSYGVCTDSFAGLLPLDLHALFRCTLPVGDLDATAAGRAFLAAYAAAYHGAVPDPLAVYGYEAMSLGIDTIADLDARGDDREAVRAALFATRARRSLLGTYGFDRAGSSTLQTYGLYRVGAAGELVFAGTLRP